MRDSRPAFSAGDLLWKVHPGLWHGWPDYWGTTPLTHKRFGVNERKALQPEFLWADQPNCPLEPAARLGVNSSSCGLDFSRNPAFGHCGEAFVEVFGDLTQPPDEKVRRPIGCRVVRVNPCNGVIEDFVIKKGKEAGQGSKERNCGIEQPVDVRFNGDGSVLDIVDFGGDDQDPGAKRPVPVHRGLMAGPAGGGLRGCMPFGPPAGSGRPGITGGARQSAGRC